MHKKGNLDGVKHQKSQPQDLTKPREEREEIKGKPSDPRG